MVLYGDIAQFGRATHLHCVGQEFDPPYLHQEKFMDIGNYIVEKKKREEAKEEKL